MFEHIVLRRAAGGNPISIGSIAEALLYYQKLHLFIDRATLFHLIQQIGTGGVLTLLNRPEVSAVYCEEILATYTESVGVSQFHIYSTMTLQGHDEVGQLKNPEARLQFELERRGISKKEVKHFSKKFLNRVPLRKFSGNYFTQGGIPEAAKIDLLDIEYTKKAFRHAVSALANGYTVREELKLEILESDLGLCVFTNLDLNSINKASVNSITIANLLNHILDARADMALASFYGGDFSTSAVTSAIIKTRHEELLRRSQINKDVREQFTELVLPDSPSLAEVIDSGERSFDEFLKLLDRADRFKDWLISTNPDEGLIQTYMRDVASEAWIQRLPVKTIRYVLTSALDKTNPVIGVAAGLVDNFLIEKLLSGWRPNHFISGKLSPFLRQD